MQELAIYDFKEEDVSVDIHQGGQVQQHNNQSSNTSTTEKCGGTHLDTVEFHNMLQKSNTIVIDVRNHCETVLGWFDGQCGNNTLVQTEKKDELHVKER